jgi:hypothetical protein
MSSDQSANGRGRTPLVVTFCDSGYLPLLALWSRRVRALGVRELRVFGLDAATVEWCRSEDVPAESMDWNGDLRTLWLRRIRIFRRLVAEGLDFIHSDIDAIWLDNPLAAESVREEPAQLLFSQGTVWPPDVLDRWGFVLCCGWFRVIASAQTQDFFDALACDVERTGDDQVSVNRLLLARGLRWESPDGEAYRLPFQDRHIQCWTRTRRGQVGELTVGLLPHREFQRLPEPSARAVVKHYLTPKNCEQKLQVLRALGLVQP